MMLGYSWPRIGAYFAIAFGLSLPIGLVTDQPWTLLITVAICWPIYGHLDRYLDNRVTPLFSDAKYCSNCGNPLTTTVIKYRLDRGPTLAVCSGECLRESAYRRRARP